MVDFVTGLRCRECARNSPPRHCTSATTASGRSRWPTTTRRIAATVSRERIAAGPRSIWRYKDLLPVDDEHAGRPRRRVHPVGAGGPPGRRARPGRAVDQGRHGQPDRLVQGPGGLGRPDQGAPARLQGGGLRLDGQPGQLGGRARGPGRAGLGGAHPARPRGGQGHHDHRLRRHRHRRRGHLRRRQPALRRADERAPQLGLRQRQRAHLLRRGLQDAGLRNRRAAGLAGPGPRGGPDRLGQPADQGGQGLQRAGQGRAAARGARRAGLGRPGRGLFPGGDRLPAGDRRHPAGQAQDDRQVAGHRQPGRRLVRPRGDAANGRLLRRGDRRRGHRGHRAARPHRGHLRRDGGRRHHRHPVQAGRLGRHPARRAGGGPGHGARPQDRRGPDRPRRAPGPPPRSPPPWPPSTRPYADEWESSR